MCTYWKCVIYICLFTTTTTPPPLPKKKKINQKQKPCRYIVHWKSRFHNFNFSILEISHVCIISFHHASSQQFPSVVFQHIVVTRHQIISRILWKENLTGNGSSCNYCMCIIWKKENMHLQFIYIHSQGPWSKCPNNVK